MMAARPPDALLLRRARVIDPARQLDFVGDILLSQGRIAAAEPNIEGRPDGCAVIDLSLIHI